MGDKTTVEGWAILASSKSGKEYVLKSDLRKLVEKYRNQLEWDYVRMSLADDILAELDQLLKEGE